MKLGHFWKIENPPLLGHCPKFSRFSILTPPLRLQIFPSFFGPYHSNFRCFRNQGFLLADPLVSPKCNRDRPKKSWKIGTIRDIFNLDSHYNKVSSNNESLKHCSACKPAQNIIPYTDKVANVGRDCHSFMNFKYLPRHFLKKFIKNMTFFRKLGG